MYFCPTRFTRLLQIIFACFLSTVILSAQNISALSNDGYDKLRVYSDVLSIIQTNYVEEVAVQNGILNIITGEISSFNPEKIFYFMSRGIKENIAKREIVKGFFESAIKDINSLFGLNPK